MFGRRTKREPPEKVAQRIARLETHEFTPWIEQCLYTIGRSLTEYNRDIARTELIDEAIASSEICTALLAELKERDAS